MIEGKPRDFDLNALRNKITSSQENPPIPKKAPWYRKLSGSEFFYHPLRFFRRKKNPSLENLRAAARKNTENPEGNK